MTEEQRKVVQVVLDFAAEKTLWEKSMNYRDTEKNSPEKLKEERYVTYFKNFEFKQYITMSLEEIEAQYEPMFNSFTTNKKRVYSGHPDTWGMPAKYEGLNSEQIVECTEVKPRRFEVIGKVPTGFKQTLKFIVLKKKDGYRIDSVKVYRKSEDKWENHLL